jgi:hypothetical protein
MTPRYGGSAKSSYLGACGGGYGVVDLSDAEAVEVEPAPLDGAGTCGWVDAGLAHCGRVAGGGMCARRPSGCRLVVLWIFCLWWPWFLDSPLLVRTVLAIKQTVESARLLRPSLASPSGAVATALGCIPDDEQFLRLGADWLCCALVGDCGCPVRSLAAKAWSRFYWTAEGP